MIRAASLCLILLAGEALAAAPQAQISPQPLADALTALARQNGLQLIYGSDAVKGRQTKGAPAGLTVSEVLAHVLQDTGLEYEFLNDRTVTIWVKGQQKPTLRRSDASDITGVLRVASVEPAAQVQAVGGTEAAPAAEESGEKGLPEMLVKGARSFNTDIHRSEDDIQPYVVFESEEIMNSMAGTLDEFLTQRLTMNNSTANTGLQPTSSFGDRSSIDLRGLGDDETLVLVNGRRQAGFAFGTSAPGQTNVNGIALSQVKRIEVLPSGAGGIHGGGATGGVVNIILRDDFQGLEVSAQYNNAFDTDYAARRVSLSSGFTLEGGRTQVNISGSYSDQSALLLGDRDFADRARALVLRNNPSAFYGLTTPPVGGTSNIRSVSGQPLVLKAGNRPLGSPITYVPYGYAGPASDTGSAFLANAGKYNIDLPAGLQGKGRSLLSTPLHQSMSLNLRRGFTEWLDVTAEASYRETDTSTHINRFPVTAITLQSNVANNPFTQAIRVTFPSPDFDYASLQQNHFALINTGVSAILRLPGKWSAQADIGWGKSERDYQNIARGTTSATATALSNGTLNVMRDTSAYPLDYTPYLFTPLPTDYTLEPYSTTMQSYALRAGGPLVNLWAGPLMLATMVGRRESTMNEYLTAVVDQNALTRYRYSAERGERTDSLYLEATVPVFFPAKGFKGMRGLDLQATYRRDRVIGNTFDGTTSTIITLENPDDPIPPTSYLSSDNASNQFTVGLRYYPVDALFVRMSYAESFLPPSITDMVPLYQTNWPATSLEDRRRKDDIVGVIPRYSLLGFGGLTPEYSASWTAGLVFAPVGVDRLRVSVDFSLIEKTDEITMIDDQLLLELEAYYPERVHRNPLTDADRLNGYTVGTINELNGGYINFAKTRTETLDLNADYGWNTTRGKFDAHLSATWQPYFRMQAQAGAPVVQTIGYSGRLKWRANMGLTWRRQAWTAGWNMQYYDDSMIYAATAPASTRTSTIANNGTDTVPRQMYHDLFVKYRFDVPGGFASMLDGAELGLGIVNVLDKSPPIIASAAASTSSYSLQGSPKLRNYTLSLRKEFGGR